MTFTKKTQNYVVSTMVLSFFSFKQADYSEGYSHDCASIYTQTPIVSTTFLLFGQQNQQTNTLFMIVLVYSLIQFG